MIRGGGGWVPQRGEYKVSVRHVCVGGVDPSETVMETDKRINGTVPNTRKKFQQNLGALSIAVSGS